MNALIIFAAIMAPVAYYLWAQHADAANAKRFEAPRQPAPTSEPDASSLKTEGETPMKSAPANIRTPDTEQKQGETQ